METLFWSRMWKFLILVSMLVTNYQSTSFCENIWKWVLSCCKLFKTISYNELLGICKSLLHLLHQVCSPYNFATNRITQTTWESERSLFPSKRKKNWLGLGTPALVHIVNESLWFLLIPVIQINIKRCHSDGCDTRIRGIKAVGYRWTPDLYF